MTHINAHIDFEGTFRVYAQDRETGVINPNPVIEEHNAILTTSGNGFDRMLNLIIDGSDASSNSVGSSAHYDNSTSRLELRNGSDTVVFSQTGCESGYPDHGTTDQVTWRWKDTSTDTYTVDDFVWGRDAGTDGTIDSTFSETTGMTAWDAGDNTGDLSKPSTQNWIYEYELSSSGGGNVITGSAGEGVDMIMRYMTGDDGSAAGASNMSQLDANGAQAHVFDTGASFNKTLGVSSGPSRPSTTSVEWVFEDSSSDSYSWDEVEVQESLNTQRLRDDTNFGGTNKGTNDTFTWTYTLSAS